MECYSPMEDKVLPDQECNLDIRPREFRTCNNDISCGEIYCCSHGALALELWYNELLFTYTTLHFVLL